MGFLERIGRGRLVVLVIVSVALVGAVFATWYRVAHFEGGASDARRVPGETDRLQVEVLNTTDAVGQARTATRRLRDAGLDVVYFGGDAGPALDSTQILVRRGTTATGTRVRRALGVGGVRVLADSTRLVDVTVRLGRDFVAGGNP
ncbi:MAG: LytR C-terminal domain-containing protein [Gemmatimonadales bacterium]